MGCIFSKIASNELNIEVLDFTLSGSEYDYLRPRGTVIFEIHEKWNVPVIHFVQVIQVLIVINLATILFFS